MAGQPAACQSITVDYSRIGNGRTFRTRLFPEERRNLHVGKHFTVVGDDVEPRDAVVTRIYPDGNQLDITLRA